MSSTTKNPDVSLTDKEKLKSYKSTIDLYGDFDKYIRETNKKTQDIKKKFSSEIKERGEEFIKEIEVKEKKLLKEKEEKISFILKKSGFVYGGKEELMEKSLNEIDSILIIVKENKRNWLSKIIDFLMTW